MKFVLECFKVIFSCLFYFIFVCFCKVDPSAINFNSNFKLYSVFTLQMFFLSNKKPWHGHDKKKNQYFN